LEENCNFTISELKASHSNLVSILQSENKSLKLQIEHKDNDLNRLGAKIEVLEKELKNI
jgi:hypothetical protein